MDIYLTVVLDLLHLSLHFDLETDLHMEEAAIGIYLDVATDMSPYEELN